ncbi:hypothetical protein NLU13_1189 [Sarocladium strictum]|uniref:Uncharacterized protein n=1 Tax=Sarocladium strictum TaxID=5046 RepID=A0AA39GQH0_SARSR|nr:hypothetical protein NLU13_1189 [Sarocladium strictum]
MRQSQQQRTMDHEDYDKDWARRYILDPLTAPEPSQESGIAGSYNAAARPLSDPKTSPGSSSGSSPKKHGFFARRLSFRSRGKQHAESVVAKSPPPPPARSELPTPPASTSPSKAEFHSSNPFSDHAPQASRDATPPANQQKYPPLRSKKHLRVVSDPHYPPGPSSRPHAPRQPPREEAPPPYRRHYSNPSPDPFYQGPLAHRYPGDMSHRPLDSAKRDTRAAERTHRRGASLHNTDIIDALDTIGGTYHHGGPYDATLASRNVNKKYSPLAAVQRSNEEAIRATPPEFIQDSLEHHVPLQGVAIIPPGGVDPRGRVMDYEEGADLMREEDAPGGAYKRWAEVRYHPDDLKGKGEPSYSLERDLKQKNKYINAAGEYELQSPRHGRLLSRQRRRSSGQWGDDSLGSSSGYHQTTVQRSNSTGKKLSDGLKRRMGSLRKKPVATAQEVN